MDDSALVEAARSGDQQAWADVYDRYTDRIHDFAYSTVQDRTTAAEVVQATFLIAFERLDQLRDPGRLGPWLFAIAHHAAVARAPGREEPEPPADLTVAVPAVPSWRSAAQAPGSTTPAPTPTPPEDPSGRELSEFVWQASSALGGRDRALLALQLRQGLQGQDLADAVGLTPPHLATTLNRLRAQFERSVGALLVARSSRRDCPRLAEILTGWNGVVTPELRARITSHVDDCETCNSRRRLVLNPLEVLASIPLIPAPAILRRVVLGQSAAGGRAGAGAGADRSPSAGWIFDADGFPYQGGDQQVDLTPTGQVTTVTSIAPAEYTRANAGYIPTRINTVSPPPLGPPGSERFAAPLPPPAGPRDRRGVVIGALAGLIVLLVGIVALVAARSNNGSNQVAVTVPTTAVAQATTTMPTTAPTTTRPAAPTTVPPGHFYVGAKGLDFGTTGQQLPLLIGNDGAGPLTFTATAANPALSIAPSSGSVDPAGKTTLTITLNRTLAPTGHLSTTIAISSGPGTAIVAVNAEIDTGPAITGEMAAPDTIRPSDCLAGPPGVTQAMITAQIAAPVPLDRTGARLHSQAPVASEARMFLNGMAATGTLGPFASVPAGGTVEWWITATDTQGVTASSAHHFITVQC